MTVFVLVEGDQVKYEVTFIYSLRLNTLFYVIYTAPDESILTGELVDEYIVPVESNSL